MNVKGYLVSLLYIISLSLGVLVEANLRYLPEWPGPPDYYPSSLIYATFLAAVLGLAWPLAMVYYCFRAWRGYCGVVYLLAAAGLLWGAWLVYLGLMALEVVEDDLLYTVPPLGVLALPMFVAWIYSSVLLKGRVYDTVVSLLVVTGSMLGMVGATLGLSLALAGLVDEWDRIAYESIILVWLSSVLMLTAPERIIRGLLE